jgi:class 3 adenylate cyclase
MTIVNGTRSPLLDPSLHPPEEVNVTLLFCDVVRSTELTRRLGDRAAYRVIETFHALVLRASAPHGGEELELRGDGVLLAFAQSGAGVDCAREIQRELLGLPPGRQVSARIGVHTGPVLRVATGYFGSNVILCSRIAARAAPGEVLVTSPVIRSLPDRDLGVSAGRWVSLKGIPEPSLVFSLPWRPARAAPAEPPCPSAAHEALLLALGRTCESLPGDADASCMLARRRAV